MSAKHRELRALLRAAEDQAGRLARRLGRANDWQYPSAVALRAHASEYARRLSEYLRPGRIERLGWCVSYQASLCTRELAPLEPLWQHASFIVWQIQTERAARPNAPRRRAPRNAALERRPAALRALFAGQPALRSDAPRT
jgi:hypothetical protein